MKNFLKVVIPADLEKANGFDPKNIAKIFHEKFNLAK
jgi:hypothetical protein